MKTEYEKALAPVLRKLLPHSDSLTIETAFRAGFTAGVDYSCSEIRSTLRVATIQRQALRMSKRPAMR